MAVTKGDLIDSIEAQNGVEREPLKSTVTQSEQQGGSGEEQNSTDGNLWAVVYFTLISGSLLVLNKVAIVHLPAPTFLMLCQLAFTAAAVWLGHAAGILTITKATPQQLVRFLPVAFGFIGTVYSNFKVLQYSNVETFITFRSSTPVILSFCDWAFLGRQLPCSRSWVALVFLIISTAGYAYFDQGFVVHAYFWIAVWYIFFTFDCVWNKHLCDTVPMTNWARVFYSNLLSTPVLALLFLGSGKEQAVVAKTKWEGATLSLVLLSCFMGVLMSHSSYLLRARMSAATAALVGIACKLLSVVLNILIWNRHAGPVELTFLAMGIVAAAFYKQAPMRSK